MNKDWLFSKKDGIKVDYFLSVTEELQSKHPLIAGRILNAVGLESGGSDTIIDWRSYLKILSFVRFYTNTRE